MGQELLAALSARVGSEDYVKGVYPFTDAGSSAEELYATCGFGRRWTKVVPGAGAERT